LAVIDGITLSPVNVRRIGVEGVTVGIPVEDARNIVLIADSFDPDDLVAVGVELGYNETVVEQFASNLLSALAPILFSDAAPEADEDEEPEPTPGLTTTSSLSME
jgi:hypothetical protein